MELNNKEDIDPLVISSINTETKINDIRNNIVKKLRPTLVQLNEEGEPSLAIAQNRSIMLPTNISYLTIKMFICSLLVDETEDNGKKAIDMLGKVVKSSEDFSKKITAWNHSMIGKLESLRNKITKAHQIADGVSFDTINKAFS